MGEQVFDVFGVDAVDREFQIVKESAAGWRKIVGVDLGSKGAGDAGECAGAGRWFQKNLCGCVFFRECNVGGDGMRVGPGLRIAGRGFVRWCEFVAWGVRRLRIFEDDRMAFAGSRHAEGCGRVLPII